MLRTKAILFVAVGAAYAVLAAGVATAADPLGLTLDQGASEVLGDGTDTVAVWVCDVGGEKDFTPDDVAAWANAEVAPFFSTVSRGRYALVFEAVGEFDRVTDCLTDGVRLTKDLPFTNALVIDNGNTPSGFGGPGAWYFANDTVLPIGRSEPPAESGRGFTIGGETFPLPATAAHEIGHTLGWPHSGSGLTGFEQYDNPADLMSGHGVDNFCPIDADLFYGPCFITHTIAFNRYASGWIDADDVALITKPRASVDLAGPEADGTQFALIPSADPLRFTTVEARPAAGYDADAGIEGVMLHTIDGTAPCGNQICWGIERRQYPSLGAPGSTDHVLGVGDSAEIHGVTVTVDAATDDGYTVSFSGAAQGCAMGPNRFDDVGAGSFAFNDVGCIRILGITTGTSASTYSPNDTVTREQMAAFLARLYRRLGQTCSGAPTPFVDIAGSFAAADIACIYELGVTTGVSSTRYDPAGTVTREQMAAFLGRLWRDALGSGCTTDPAPFSDSGGSFAKNEIACIYALGLTTGTTPTTYSPGDAVTREQMASFLARFWKTA
ncbi:MAG: S-layer homology domain-containing protein [Acidimicrobiales bacterium]